MCIRDSHRFWPYFNVIGWGIDDRLVELLDNPPSSASITRRDVVHALERLSNALDDAHSFIYDWARDASEQPAGYFPVWLERAGDVAFVRQSGMAELGPGDAITSIRGMSVADYYEQEAGTISAATPANRDAQVS